MRLLFFLLFMTLSLFANYKEFAQKYGYEINYEVALKKAKKTDIFIDDYQNNLNNTVRKAFEENNAYSDWTPKTKLNLIHCVDDEIVPFSISTYKAYNELNATGADVTLTPIPTLLIPPESPSAPFVHQRCANVAYGAAVTWFDGIRQGKIQ